MSGVNKVILIGRLGADPEVKYLPDGTVVAKVSLATSETWKDKAGEKQEKTEWHRVVMWRRLAEICGEYLHKGSQIYVEGKLQTRSWEDSDGNRKWSTEVVANTMQMLESKGGGAASTEYYGEPPPEKTGGMLADDEIPF